MRQIETSTTCVFDDPRRARAFFEALVHDNVGIGRPGEVAMVFSRPLRRPTKHIYRQRIFGTGTELRMDFSSGATIGHSCADRLTTSQRLSGRRPGRVHRSIRTA